MKKLLIATLMSGICAGQSIALSCLEPSIESSFAQYSKAEETYVLVLGGFSDKRNVVPEHEQGSGKKRMRGESFVATFNGQQATRSGFDLPLDISVAITGVCLASWCGKVSVDKPVLAFFKKTAFGFVLTEGPCGGAVFYNPNKDTTAKALQCLRGGVCDMPF